MHRRAILLLAGCAAPALGQTAPAPPERPEDTSDIIVVGLPLPPAAGAYGPVVIDRDRLTATASGRIEEALARIPGFQQFRRSDSRSANPSAQGITLRAIGGNASSRTLLLLDGVPQADAFFGFIPFTALSADSIASARVVRGSGVGPFGSGAVAGTIELLSRDPASRVPLSLAATIGSDDAREAVVGIALPLGAGHIAIDARHDRGDGFFTTPRSQRGPASVRARYRATQASISAAIPLGDRLDLYPRVSGFSDDRTLRFAGADSTADGVDASLRLVSRGRWRSEALGWLQMRDFSTIVVSAATLRPTLDQRATPTTGWGGKLELRPPGTATRLLRFGADIRGATGEAVEDVLAAGNRTLTRSAGGRTTTLGAFVEGDLILGSLALTAGARIDHWRLSGGRAREVRTNGVPTRDDRFAARSDTIPSVRGAASFAVSEVIALRASAYTGFRLPTLNELYRGFTVFPVVTRANAALDPERLRGWEIGVDVRPVEGVEAALTLFDNRLRDAIANVTVAQNVRERRNVSAIRARGIEASLSLATGPWRLDAGWSYSDARVRAPGTALDDQRPAQSPRHTGSATLAWTRQGWLAQLGARYVGDQFEDDLGVDRLPAVTTFDALVRAPLSHRLSLVLRAENLTDATVVARNAAGSIDLGAPRTWWVGLRWNG